MVCKLQHTTARALAPVAEAALVYTRDHPANVDETGWKQGRQRAWLWVAVTTFVVAFLIRRTRGRAAFDDLRAGSTAGPHDGPVSGVHPPVPAQAAGVLGAPAARLPGDDRPGRFRGGDRRGAVGVFGRPVRVLVSGTGRNLGPSPRSDPIDVPDLRRQVGEHLRSGAACGCAKTAATCAELLAVEASLWTFARVPGVEPTNNAAEREVRHAVCWRKTSFGTDSERGSRFVERVLTVVALVPATEPQRVGVPHRRYHRPPHRRRAPDPAPGLITHRVCILTR